MKPFHGAMLMFHVVMETFYWNMFYNSVSGFLFLHPTPVIIFAYQFRYILIC